MKYKKCRKCGRDNPMENRYCSKCGAAFRNMVPLKEIEETVGSNKRAMTLTLIVTVVVAISIVLLTGIMKSQAKPATEPTITAVITTAEVTITECIHDWYPADCATPKTCEICGETSGVALDHQWEDATYEAPKTCSLCGATDGVALEKPSINTNDIVAFGSYEQDGLQSNGEESIEWIVLEVLEDKALLLSCYALDSLPYNDTYGPVTWEDCTLRNWLNSTFYDDAFTDEEKKSIILSEIDNSKAQGNREWSASGGNNTEDNIFLLSYADTERYFDGSLDRICVPTNYAVTMGADKRTLDDGITEAGWWWLRSPGEMGHHAAFVNFDGTRYTNAVGNEYLSVRPALWIKLDVR